MLISGSIQSEVVISIVAIVFFVIGAIINRRTIQKESLRPSTIDLEKIKELGLSKRELEVLCEVAQGLSNLEIANKLYVSESTIKTHVSNLLVKLNAKRRTHAIQIAKELNII